MRIKVWGCRGSIPSPGPETNKYGGNTSCIEVSHGDTRIILDGGSGIQRLGHQLNSEHKEIHILLTHLHIDHTMGLGFFMPLYNPDVTIHLYGPAGSRESLLSRLRRYFSPPLFPVRLNELATHPRIHEVNEGWMEIGDLRILSKYVCHPGPTLGYRIEAGGSSFTYIPDHELGLGAPDFPNEPEWISGFDLAHKTDLLFHDAQYTKEEYAKRVGWGHSSMEDAIQFAKTCEAKKLCLFHHDPGRYDNEMDMLIDKLHKAHSPSFELCMCSENTVIEI